jgi:hypothetical protein
MTLLYHNMTLLYHNMTLLYHNTSNQNSKCILCLLFDFLLFSDVVAYSDLLVCVQLKHLGSQTGETILNDGQRFVIDSEVLFQKLFGTHKMPG